MPYDWKPIGLIEIGDQVGRVILLITDEGAYMGGLKGIGQYDIYVETDEGRVIAIPRSVLTQDHTQLYIMELM